MPLDTSCHTVNDNHRNISAASEHAQEHAQCGSSQQHDNYPANSHLRHGNAIETNQNDNGLRDFFPQTPMARYRRLWHRQDMFTRYNQLEEVDAEPEETSREDPSPVTVNNGGSPLFGLPRNGTPLIGRRSLFDPSLWQPLLGAADHDLHLVRNLDPITNGGISDVDVHNECGDFTTNYNLNISNRENNNNNCSSRGQLFYEIFGATDQESSDEVSQISDLSRTCSNASSSNLDLNAILQNTVNAAGEISSLNPPALLQNQDNVQNAADPNNPQSRTGSGRSGSLNMRREWYFYDPRLVPGNRPDRITMETYFGGIRNELSLPAMIGPPAYEDIIGDEVTGLEMVPVVTDPNNWLFGSPPHAEVVHIPEDPPPPYSELPPTYEQTMENDMLSPNVDGPATGDASSGNPLFHRTFDNIAICHGNRVANFNNFNAIRLSNLHSSPVMNHLAAINEVNRLADEHDLDFDLDIDLELMEVRGRPYNLDEDDQSNFDDLDIDIDGMFDLDNDFDPNDLEEDEEESVRSLSRHPVGFCLGQRPAVRWSRGMGLDRWAASPNWAA